MGFALLRRVLVCIFFWLAETVLRRTRANAEIEAGWRGADAAKKAEVLAPATATRDGFIGHHMVGPYYRENQEIGKWQLPD